jgi:hypothetical protein
MSPPSVATALQQLDQEIAYFNANTDALVIDVTRNPGGLVSFVEAISQRFIPTPFHTIGFEIRATGAWLFSFAAALNNALATGAPPEIVANLRITSTRCSTLSTRIAAGACRSRSIPPEA